ncbi:hypothetical protein NMY22_g4916 [Coprinellus aureogranulatus]|nr:hypothetical protein NMY22_g4916 [Coprinellus aureogranulatus]
MTFSSQTISIAIVGGGPAGLTLAAILTKLSIPYTVFELDASPQARKQGGMFDIHKGSGQRALEKAGLFEEFKKHMRVDATELYLRDWTGKVHLHHTEEGSEEPERPEIDRAKLREILLDAVDSQRIKWGKKLVKAEADDAGKFTLNFADGTSEGGFDVVVGADGTWSRIRPLRSDVAPPYSGVMGVCTSISSIDERFPELAKFVGKGSSMVVSGKDLVSSQKNGDGSVKTYALFEAPENWKEISGVDWSKPTREALTDFVERYYPNWTEEVKRLLIECDEGELAVRPLYQYPPGHKLEKKLTGVTLAGDAAHVMTPLTGVGVNLAMHDAYELSVAIEKISMFARATENAKRTRHSQSVFFSGLEVEGVIQGLFKMFAGEA